MPSPFRKSGRQAGVDVDAVVRKLKGLYSLYADRYGPKLFNLRAFEQRYRNALASRANLPSFCHAEITVFEELKGRVEKKTPEAKVPGFGKVADRILEENLKRVRGYRRIAFHPDAEEESLYLLGAVTDFYFEVWSGARRILKSLGERSFDDSMEKIEHDFTYYVVPMGGLYSRAVQDYQLVLSRHDAREAEKASYRFIKNGALLLNDCLRLVYDALNLMRTKQEHTKGEGELRTVMNTLKHIIADFRLGDIRSY